MLKRHYQPDYDSPMKPTDYRRALLDRLGKAAKAVLVPVRPGVWKLAELTNNDNYVRINTIRCTAKNGLAQEIAC